MKKLYPCTDCGEKTDNPDLCRDSSGSGCNSTKIKKALMWYGEQANHSFG